MASLTSSDPIPIATMIHTVTIKLSSSNYLLWRRQVMPMLTSFDLLGHVDGTSAAPERTVASSSDGQPALNPAYATWHTKDQKLLGVLFSTLSEEAMAVVVDCKTSRDAWIALEAAFYHSSSPRANQLREELLALRRGSLSVQDYGKNFKSLCDQLSVIGCPVDESDKSHWFLRGLEIEFASFADARMAMNPIPTFYVLLHQAIQFDIMRRAMEASPHQPQAAFAASTQDGYGSGQNRPQDRHISTNTSTSLTCKLAMSSRAHKGKCINMEANEDDETPESLEERLSNYRKPIRPPFIYRVHSSCLRGSNDNAHEPRMLAIGPYHHGKRSLKVMEERKLCYLKSFLHRKNESVDRYRSAIAEIEEEARSCYAEELYMSKDEFIDMLVLDSCFIIELSRKFQKRDSNCDSDPIFQMGWIIKNLRRDLVLFENQIPFFVLCKIFNLIKGDGLSQLIDSIRHFLSYGSLFETGEVKHVLYLDFQLEVRHLLDLRHATQRPSYNTYINLRQCPTQREYLWIPSATELKDANITFRKSKGNSSIPLEVGFSNGVLTMSTLTIHDQTDCDLRNLIVYEQYFPGDQPTYVTDYVMVLDCLVNTGRDVEILEQHGIVWNMTGNNKMAADIINRLARYVMVSQTYFSHTDTFYDINDHHKRRWNKAMAALNRDYFNTPWAYFSFVAAVLLLLLTLAQTVISVVQL